VKALDQATVTAVLEDWRTAPVSDRLRAALQFLEAMTLRPTDVTPQLIRELKAAGLNDRAIREAAYVGFLFNTLDRLADALDFTEPTEAEARAISGLLLRFGYALTKLPG
jgi:alkylhydroperoxidase family enzyme